MSGEASEPAPGAFLRAQAAGRGPGQGCSDGWVQGGAWGLARAGTGQGQPPPSRRPCVVLPPFTVPWAGPLS